MSGLGLRYAAEKLVDSAPFAAELAHVVAVAREKLGKMLQLCSAGAAGTYIENLKRENAHRYAEVMRYRVDERCDDARLREEVARAGPGEQAAGDEQAGGEDIVAGLSAQLLHKEIDAAGTHHGLRGDIVAGSMSGENAAQLEHVVHAKNVTI